MKIVIVGSGGMVGQGVLLTSLAAKDVSDIILLVRKQPEMAVQVGEILGLGMVIFGGYRILNALIAEAEKQEKAREKQPEDN